MKSLGLALLFIASLASAQTVGDSVQVSIASNDCLNLRTIASVSGSTIIRCYPNGTRGIIIGPSVPDVNGSSSYVFFQVKFNDGNSGWARDFYLVKIVPPVPPSYPVSAADSLRIFNLGFAYGQMSVKTVDSITIQMQGFKSLKLVNDSTIVAKP